MIYCDSSFLVSLYLQTQFFSAAARELVDSFDEPLAFSWLNELEMVTVLHRSLSSGLLHKTLRAIDAARDSGILVPCVVDDHQAYLHRALDLSKRHAAGIGCRSLDILHVALALELKAPSFVSFDRRQRRLAEAVRLKILPEELDHL